VVPKLGMVTSKKTKEGCLARSYFGDTAVELDGGPLSSMGSARHLGLAMARPSARPARKDGF
jgi:hypothetical protein